MSNAAENSITGFVLAGGESTRMGSDKAFLRLGAESLLARALRLAGAVCAEVRIAGSAARFASHGTVVEDIYQGRGPLGGIHAALSRSATDLNLVLAVDLPFVEVRFLEYLAARARAGDAIVTVPHASGGWQPLCALYRRAFAKTAEAALAQGKNKIDALFASVKTEIIEEDELTRAGFSPAMFRNLNTPEDWEWAQHHL
jgi:molybdopterin-guanine dinucleotide biosynthesis protein A